MSYIPVQTIDHGLIRFGANCYGGIAYRAGTLEGPSSPSAEGLNSAGPLCRFITEHNLALSWRRPGLYPRTIGLPIPLLHTADYGEPKGLLERPMGCIRADCPPVRHRNRNLLAGQNIWDAEDRIRLWTVTDLSDHRLLLQLDLQLEQAHCDKTGLLGVGRVQTETDPIVSMSLPNDALQLKASDGSGDSVFMRSRRCLELATPNRQSLSTVFNSFVHSFVQIPYFDDEVAVVDSCGHLFWGSINNSSSSFTRAKTPFSLKELCPTDCPRVLLALGDEELREVDLRDHNNCSGNLLFARSPLQPLDLIFSEKIYGKLSARDVFWHVNQLDVQLDTVLLTSSRQHILVDRRMPGMPLLTMDHAEMEGADYAMTTQPFVDELTGLRVFSIFSLTQIRRPAVSHWSVAFHPKEGLWSSIAPKYELDSPRLLVDRLLQSHVELTRVDIPSLPLLTRAIHFQPLHPDLRISSTRALLFRQMEGGELWYENVLFDPLARQGHIPAFGKAMEENEDLDGSFSVKPMDDYVLRKECLARIQHYQEERDGLAPWIPHCYRGVDKELLQKESITFLSADHLLAQGHFEPIDETLREQLLDADNPFAGEGQLATTTISLSQTNFGQAFSEEKYQFSNCIRAIWQKTLTDLDAPASAEETMQIDNSLLDKKIAESEEEENENEWDESEGTEKRGKKRKREPTESGLMMKGTVAEDGMEADAEEEEEDEMGDLAEEEMEMVGRMSKVTMGQGPMEQQRQGRGEEEPEDEYDFDVELTD